MPARITFCSSLYLKKQQMPATITFCSFLYLKIAKSCQNHILFILIYKNSKCLLVSHFVHLYILRICLGRKKLTNIMQAISSLKYIVCFLPFQETKKLHYKCPDRIYLQMCPQKSMVFIPPIRTHRVYMFLVGQKSQYRNPEPPNYIWFNCEGKALKDLLLSH